MTDDELNQLVDHGSATPGLDALETLSSAWYRAAAESSPSAPVLLRDIACRIRAATTFPELRGRPLPAPHPAELGTRVLAPAMRDEPPGAAHLSSHPAAPIER